MAARIAWVELNRGLALLLRLGGLTREELAPRHTGVRVRAAG